MKQLSFKVNAKALFFIMFISMFFSAFIVSTAHARTRTLYAFGPGGPAPAMREAAKLFEAKKGIKVNIVAGPLPKWKGQAYRKADLIFSGSENMMTNFVRKNLRGLINASSIQSLYLRPSAILVRPGNPKGIHGIKDLSKSGVKVLVVEGAGQVGLWEDVVGRTADIQLINGVRRNIAFFAVNSAQAKKKWYGDKSFDAWLIWTIWQKENQSAADLINVEPEHRIYRSAGIALTKRSNNNKLAQEFIEFLKTDEVKKIFIKKGWLAP